MTLCPICKSLRIRPCGVRFTPGEWQQPYICLDCGLVWSKMIDTSEPGAWDRILAASEKEAKG